MHNLINRTFKAIPRDYYISKLLVGSALAAPMLFLLGHAVSVSPEHTPLGLIVGTLLVFSGLTALYPYSQYAADALLRQIKGDGVYIVSVLALIAGKVIVVVVCWACSPYIAPFGLVALYFGKGKAVGRR